MRGWTGGWPDAFRMTICASGHQSSDSLFSGAQRSSYCAPFIATTRGLDRRVHQSDEKLWLHEATAPGGVKFGGGLRCDRVLQ